jgi:hypothetical protein
MSNSSNPEGNEYSPLVDKNKTSPTTVSKSQKRKNMAALAKIESADYEVVTFNTLHPKIKIKYRVEWGDMHLVYACTGPPIKSDDREVYHLRQGYTVNPAVEMCIKCKKPLFQSEKDVEHALKATDKFKEIVDARAKKDWIGKLIPHQGKCIQNSGYR